MKKLDLLFIGPVASQSGYGAHARDILLGLINSEKYDVKIIQTLWGMTPANYLKPNNENHKLILDRIIAVPLQKQPDVLVQFGLPNEFNPIGKVNIGITAGVETDKCSADFIMGLNKMNMTIVPSNFTKAVFTNCTYNKVNTVTNQIEDILKCNKPIEVLFEGADIEIYKRTNDIHKSIIDELNYIQETFVFLFVGHWLPGSFGNDRKDLSSLIHTFFNTFKNQSSPPALLLKSSRGVNSASDREDVLKRIDDIRKMFSDTDSLPNVYLLHGELTDDEMNSLYNHPKIKVHISFTRGEGFCVKGYTKVICDNTIKRIDSLKIGDMVLTHTGKYQKIKNTMNRKYDGYMYNIVPYCSYNKEKIFLTNNHNIYVYNKKNDNFLWKPAEEISLTDYLCFPIPTQNKFVHDINIFDYIDNYSVHCNQYMPTHNNLILENNIIKYYHSDKTNAHEIPNNIKLNSDFGKIIGYYLSEGCLSNGEIIFCLHKKEKTTVVNEIISAMKSVFGLTTYRIKQSKTDKKSLTVHFHSKIVSLFLEKLCGKGARRKFINDIFLNAPVDFINNLISSLLVGDGYIQNNSISIALVNSDILRKIRLLLLRMNVISSYEVKDKNKINKKPYIKHKFNGDIHILKINMRHSVNIVLNLLNDNHTFCKYLISQNKRKNYIGGHSAFIKNNMIIFPIKSINVKKYVGDVYNISVENDESYCLENFVVHNCRPLLEASLSGKPVIAPAWSGHIDFLKPEFSTLMPGKLVPIDSSAVMDNILIKDSNWFRVDYTYAVSVMKDIKRNYKLYAERALKQKNHSRDNFNLELMYKKLDEIMDKYVSNIPTEIKIELPKLEKIELPTLE